MTKVHRLALWAEVKDTIIPNGLISTNVPVNMLEHHSTRIPPEAPEEGEKTKLSNLHRQNFLIAR